MKVTFLEYIYTISTGINGSNVDKGWSNAMHQFPASTSNNYIKKGHEVRPCMLHSLGEALFWVVLAWVLGLKLAFTRPVKSARRRAS